MVNWERIEMNWKDLKGSAKEKWAKLTDSDLEQIAGRHDQLAGRLQELYGRREGEIEADLREWQRALEETDQPRDTSL